MIGSETAELLKNCFRIGEQKNLLGSMIIETIRLSRMELSIKKVWNSPGKKKILFVLKEAYGNWENNTLTNWLCTDHPKRKIWRRIAKLTQGIQNTDSLIIQRYKPELSENEHNDALEQIAVMNLKKSHGSSRSYYDDIRGYALYDRNELQKEFELIDADVIICGNVFGILCEVLFGNRIREESKNDNWYYYLKYNEKDRLFIDYYHPAVQWSDLLVYYGLMGVYQQALLEKYRTNDTCTAHT